MAETADPYVGLRAYREEESAWFFGRTREIRELRTLVLARRAVLLYAPSGAGKSSLLHAGLIPELRKAGTVLLVARPGTADTAETAPANPFVSGLLNSLLAGVEPADPARTSLLRGLSLRLAAEPLAERLLPHFLILDQAEEIFSGAAGTAGDTDRRELFRQLREALDAHRRLSLLLVLREDFLARLDPYLPTLPDHLRTRLRLDLLDAASACEAVAGPARKAGGTIDDELVKVLVDNLLGGGDRVDPIHLQLVCFRLWNEAKRHRETRIGRELVEDLGSVDEALRSYYSDRMHEAARATGISEKTIRTWIETRLISRDGIRVPVLCGVDQGLPDAAISELDAARLIRTEVRRGATWYELAHDRLIPPVREENERWRQENLSELEHQAALWVRSGHPRDLLVWDAALDRWMEWADLNPGEMGPAETAFLGACGRERRKVFWRRTYLSVITGLFFLVLHFYRQARRAGRRDRRRLRRRA